MVQGLALLLDEDNEDGTVDYDGYTDIWWDEQKSVYDKQGRVTLVCYEGHEWQTEKTD